MGKKKVKKIMKRLKTIAFIRILISNRSNFEDKIKKIWKFLQ
ncbi:hypothetical protein CAEBREN_25226 [Caenorhabditis brenneri]|uniref:Uncharacterized protein n=1 Tax=Caenorhabditis brenneri TaxID=135651 RepID=G0N5I8_CAEBE|nr:hypothetical protein CAEBREN_25226 [Caenorhabditis brenneri]